MNNTQYHQARAKVLNWKRLSVSMRARYGAWKVASDSSWSTNYKVTVTHHNGKKLKNVLVYPFESWLDAETCKLWWRENGCLAVSEEAIT